MKNKLLIILCGVILSSCSFSSEPILNGQVHDLDIDTLYLYRIENEFYNTLDLIVAVPVINNEFIIRTDTLAPEIYYISTYHNKSDEVIDGGYLFIEPVPMKVNISMSKQKKIVISSSGSNYSSLFESFMSNRDSISQVVKLDSLNLLFYKAKEDGDSDKMAVIKEQSTSIINNAQENRSKFINEELERHKGNLIGMYLFYIYKYKEQSLNRSDEIEDLEKYIDSFDKTSRESIYYKKIKQELDRFSRCAIGNLAPHIEGVSIEGDTISLADFKGKYVLIDFWSSGCYPCRLENPILQKTFKNFKNNNFTILGVSCDLRKKDWISAIEEDKSFWNQILLTKKNISSILNSYCISGIPHILLIDPDGVILAKNLRGDDVFNTVSNHIDSK